MGICMTRLPARSRCIVAKLSSSLRPVHEPFGVPQRRCCPLLHGPPRRGPSTGATAIEPGSSDLVWFNDEIWTGPDDGVGAMLRRALGLTEAMLRPLKWTTAAPPGPMHWAADTSRLNAISCRRISRCFIGFRMRRSNDCRHWLCRPHRWKSVSRRTLPRSRRSIRRHAARTGAPARL